MNMVGTPYSDVPPKSCTASSAAAGVKLRPGMMVAAPWLSAFRFPITIPKQW